MSSQPKTSPENEVWPPCRLACPVHADVRSYVNLIGKGRFADALAVIRRRLPYAAVCGRICDHPCEANCRRRDVDGAVAIREVKRFVAEHPDHAEFPAQPGAGDKERVAVIGSGPGGLSAALELARRGYRPTVFERESRPGGIPAVAIPGYRLPQEALQRDVRWIVAHGIKLKTGVQVGREVTIKKLHQSGYAAVVIAVGMSSSRLLPLPGIDTPGVYGALDFLRAVAADRPPAVGREVLVVGGGNVACDVARTAVRLADQGAVPPDRSRRQVRMLCLESEEEMPALPEEIDEAREEGIELITRRGPVEIIAEKGRLGGLQHRKVTRVFDDQGRFAPEFDDRDQQSTTADTIIFAIGQALDPDFIKDSGLQLDQRGRLAADPHTRQTEVPWIFAAGEAMSPPGSVVQACAHGRRTAEAVDQYLRHGVVAAAVASPPAIGRLEPATAAAVTAVARVPLEVRPPARRRQDFAPFVGTLKPLPAVREARRCLECGNGARVSRDQCVKCLNCVRLCPYQAPHVNDVAEITPERCLACGICHGACPTGAISMAGGTPEELAVTVAQRLTQLADTAPKEVAFICARTAGVEVTDAAGTNAAGADTADTADNAGAARTAGTDADLPKPVLPERHNCARIYLTSPGQLDDRRLLATLEAGADTVLVVLGPESDDYHRGVGRRLRRQVARLRRDLAALELPEEKMQLLELGC